MTTIPYICLAIGLLILAATGYLAIKKGYQQKVYRIIYQLVCRAEQQIIGTKRGQERKAQVVAAIHNWLPTWAKLFITEQDIDDLIELAVAKMKAVLVECAEASE